MALLPKGTAQRVPVQILKNTERIAHKSFAQNMFNRNRGPFISAPSGRAQRRRMRWGLGPGRRLSGSWATPGAGGALEHVTEGPVPTLVLRAGSGAGVPPPNSAKTPPTERGLSTRRGRHRG